MKPKNSDSDEKSESETAKHVQRDILSGTSSASDVLPESGDEDPIYPQSDRDSDGPDHPYPI